MATLITLVPLSSLLTAQSEPLYDENNIAYVLSVIDNPASSPQLDKQKLHRALPIQKLIRVKDLIDENLLRYLTEACDFIKEGIESDNGAVLVHCQMGRSRSGAVVDAYSELFLHRSRRHGSVVVSEWLVDLLVVMREYDLTYDEALGRAREGRWSIRPNFGFEEQLELWRVCDFDILDKDGKEKPAYVDFKAKLPCPPRPPFSGLFGPRSGK